MYVRELLSRDVDARAVGIRTLQQSTTQNADTMRASDKMDSCNIRAALQILQTSTRAPQNLQTVAEIHSPAAVETDGLETASKRSVQRYQASRNETFTPTSKHWQSAWPGVLYWRLSWVPADGATLTSRPSDSLSEDRPCCAT